MRVLSWINFILGLWLIFAGFAFSRGAQPVMAQEIIMGIIIAVLSYIGMRQANPAFSWLVALAGLWVLIAPAVINYTAAPRSKGNDIIIGIIVLILGVANALYRQSPVRTTRT